MRSRPRSRTRLLVATLLALALAVGAGQGFAGTLVERTVAFVNKKPVLLSDVELTKALLKLEEKEAIESAIDERLMFEDASRLASDTPPEELVVRAVQVLREKAGERFTSAALRRKAVIQVAISSYMDQRLRPQVRVEDTEVRKAFNDKILNDPQPPAFSLVADALRKSLEQRSLDQKIEEWVASLRRREEVRRVPTRP
jgi:hypothetical protein